MLSNIDYACSTNIDCGNYNVSVQNTVNFGVKASLINTWYLQKRSEERNTLGENSDIDKFLDSLPSVSKSKFEATNFDAMTSTLGVWRPRGALARALMDRMKNDEYLENLDQTQWYKVDLDRMTSRARGLFHPLFADGATERWLAGARTTAANLPLQVYHSIARMILGLFMTQTDVNGWLHRGSMFVVSTSQLSSLLTASGYYATDEQKIKHSTKSSSYDKYAERNHSKKFLEDVDSSEHIPAETQKSTANDLFPVKKRLLDLGAGDGEITSKMEPLFDEIAVTEVSSTMCNRLAQRGYSVLDVDTWMNQGPYDLISCLNLLDRCSNPRSLLNDVRNSLSPGGMVLVALVLPFKPYVERGTKDNRPLEYLNIHGSCFEEQVESFFDDLREMGFKVRAWSRVPYLCNGDLNQAYYHLDDVLVVMSKSEDPDL